VRHRETGATGLPPADAATGSSFTPHADGRVPGDGRSRALGTRTQRDQDQWVGKSDCDVDLSTDHFVVGATGVAAVPPSSLLVILTWI